MTAKEQLLEYVQGLTEEEAIDVLPFIVGPGPSFPPAPPEVMELLRHAQENRRLGGKSYTTEEVRRSLGLD
jgi:hypothetical protein